MSMVERPADVTSEGAVKIVSNTYGSCERVWFIGRQILDAKSQIVGRSCAANSISEGPGEPNKERRIIDIGRRRWAVACVRGARCNCECRGGKYLFHIIPH